jgi:hypothetical protein
MRPDSDLMYQIPRVAWTGGDPPKPLAEISRGERRLITSAFREAMQASVDYWGDGAALCFTGTYNTVSHKSTLCNARIQWKRARYDAHASIRAAHRSGLYKSRD